MDCIIITLSIGPCILYRTMPQNLSIYFSIYYYYQWRWLEHRIDSRPSRLGWHVTHFVVCAVCKTQQTNKLWKMVVEVIQTYNIYCAWVELSYLQFFKLWIGTKCILWFLWLLWLLWLNVYCENSLNYTNDIILLELVFHTFLKIFWLHSRKNLNK